MVVLASGHTYLAGPDPGTSWFFDDVDADPFAWGDIGDLDGGAPGDDRAASGRAGRADQADGARRDRVQRRAVDDHHGGLRRERPAGQGLAGRGVNVIGRGHANTVLLPDGSMVQVGGGRGSDRPTFPSPLHYADEAQKQIELWDPVTKQWTLGPAQTEKRAYHSTAMLLPDGRVMSAGDEYHVDAANANPANVDDAEIYKPPYLFRGPASEDRLGPGHGRVRLELRRRHARQEHQAGGARRAGGRDARRGHEPADAPARRRAAHRLREGDRADRPDAAPPGYYMLFLLNDQGVPSEAKFVKLQAGGTLGGCDTAAPADMEAPDGGAARAGRRRHRVRQARKVGRRRRRHAASWESSSRSTARTSAPRTARRPTR